MTADDALLAATALHAGFQVTVTNVVYPALRDVPAERWPAAHAAHSRRISLVVAPLYLLVVAACAAVVLSGPSWADAVAVGGNALALATTAAVAAPLHGRLGREGRTDRRVAVLLLADRVRMLAAVLALAALVAGSLAG